MTSTMMRTINLTGLFLVRALHLQASKIIEKKGLAIPI